MCVCVYLQPTMASWIFIDLFKTDSISESCFQSRHLSVHIRFTNFFLCPSPIPQERSITGQRERPSLKQISADQNMSCHVQKKGFSLDQAGNRVFCKHEINFKKKQKKEKKRGKKKKREKLALLNSDTSPCLKLCQSTWPLTNLK